ncbi:hypothetical protein AB837_00422 [bacterium AB1]|nr:hypothetical protein AB837_00422 [bacterium AB1]
MPVERVKSNLNQMYVLSQQLKKTPEQELKENAKKIQTQPTIRDVFFSHVKNVTIKYHPKKTEWLKEEVEANKQLEEHANSIKITNFTEKMKKVKQLIKTKDFSQNTKYKSRIKEIIQKEFTSLSPNILLCMATEIESVLYICEVDFIDDNIELEKQFAQDITAIVNKYKYYLNSNTLSQIISLGKEISKDSKNFIDLCIYNEFKSKKEMNQDKINKMVVNAKIDLGQFLELSEIIRQTSDIYSIDNFIETLLLSFDISKDEVKKTISSYITKVHKHYPHNVRKIEKNLNMSAQEIANLIADYLYNASIAFKEHSQQITHQDIMDLFYKE